MSLEQRIEQLEGRVRRDRLLILLQLVISLATLLVGISLLRSPRDLVARRISLVDEQGQARVELKSLEGGAYGLLFRDRSGQPRALFETEPDGTPRLSFANPAGQRLADLTVFGDAPRLMLAHPEGPPFFSAGLQMDGSARLEISDRTGRARMVLAADEDGSPTLALVDRLGQVRAQLMVSGESPSLTLQGREGNTFKAPMD